MTLDDFTKKVETYDGAVAWAEYTLRACMRFSPETFEADGLERSVDTSIGVAALKFGDDSLVERASLSFPSYQALCFGCAVFLREGNDLPNWAKAWLADLLTGKAVVPPRPIGAPKRSGLHQLVCLLIENLIDAGWNGFRNDVSEEPSACDVLAQALLRTDLQPATFEGVKRIFMRWNKSNHKNEKALRG